MEIVSTNFGKKLVCKPKYDVILVRYKQHIPVTMTTIRHWSILEFGRGHTIKLSPRTSSYLYTPLVSNLQLVDHRLCSWKTSQKSMQRSHILLQDAGLLFHLYGHCSILFAKSMSFVQVVISILVNDLFFCSRFICFYKASTSGRAFSVLVLLTTFYIVIYIYAYIKKPLYKFQPGAPYNLNPPFEWWQHTPLWESNSNDERLCLNSVDTDTIFWASVKLFDGRHR